MGRFLPLYVRRSDGKLETLNSHKRKEGNQPTTEQLDSSPDATGTSDYYRTVALEEAKHLDWRRKLGSMLARELGLVDSDKGYILVAFPENYRLFEHVKTVKRANEPGRSVTTTKTHAGGGNDRQDAYLYGHPMGRKKRFRSPADFFPHLLWLCTDEAGDPDNCTCKICCPEELDERSAAPPLSVAVAEKQPAVSAAVKRESVPPVPVTQTPVTATAAAAAAAAGPALPTQAANTANTIGSGNGNTSAINKVNNSSNTLPTAAPATAAAATSASSTATTSATAAARSVANPAASASSSIFPPSLQAQQPIHRQSTPRDLAPVNQPLSLATTQRNMSSPSQPTTPQPPVQRPLPIPRFLDQEIDLRYESFLFRQGEMVWYNRGTAWGLGVITQRWKLPNDTAKAYFRVQPLSWPGEPLASETKSTVDLRPWLAWSVPPFTNQALNNLPNLTWDTADWRAIQQGRFGQGEIGVDGSILAAKQVDASYTTFALESRTEPTPGIVELRWSGIFLGAEKIWVGDSVRIKTPNPTDIRILVVREILEHTQSSAFNAQSWKRLDLVGDVFAYSEIRHNNTRQPTPQGWIKPGITGRMAEDMRRRNPHTVGGKGTAMFWNNIANQQNAQVDIKNVKGRWYEASLLLPLLKGLAAYQNELKQGEILEAGQMMNARGDCNIGGVATDLRKPERKDALGKSVPGDLAFIDGIDPPTLPHQQQHRQPQPQHQHQLHQQQQQPQQQQQQQQQHHIPGANNGSVGMPHATGHAPHDPTFEFMDMDSIDASHDGMTGFGNGGVNHSFF
ncbi:hypothetical protein AAFC00_003504 [Neodothiora populina]|uniref:Transcription-silencing protein Clr2 n=1 Tax=Neodothiora populina TaxID=2781224 RepID=A0ABR3PEE5_9PEZI